MRTQSIQFIVSDDHHTIHRIEWKALVDVEHTTEKDIYSMDHELEWGRACAYYDKYFDLKVIIVQTPIVVDTGLRIVDVINKVPVSKRDIELNKLNERII